MPAYPQLIVDIHCHFFNARCLPLAGIIANAMGKDANESILARLTAKLLNALTESEYTPIAALSMADDPVDYYIEQLSQLTIQQLDAPSYFNLSLTAKMQGAVQQSASRFAEQRIETSEIYQCLQEIDRYLVDEGRLEFRTDQIQGLSSLSAWARKVVETTFRTLEKAINFRGEIQNYAEFFFNMLRAEEHMAYTLIEDYGHDLPPLQLVHHMMDMEWAYVVNETPIEMVAPKYGFLDTQFLRMQAIQHKYAGKILGFAAFDPRRDNWQDVVQLALKRGFLGFKFYPAMGYRPIGNCDPNLEKKVREFFTFCTREDIPVFTHCTPTGFETRFKCGLNTHPAIWAELLCTPGFENLRLCFGHGGGGSDTRENGVNYYGWTARDTSEWDATDNFACIVASLCRKYKNVYCEIAYITDLFEKSKSEQQQARIALKDNLIRARKSHGVEEHYDFMTKIAYGSDWHMPSMVRHSREYLDIFLEMFDDSNPVLSPFREQFFWENAYRYLKI